MKFILMTPAPKSIFLQDDRFIHVQVVGFPAVSELTKLHLQSCKVTFFFHYGLDQKINLKDAYVDLFQPEVKHF